MSKITRQSVREKTVRGVRIRKTVTVTITKPTKRKK